MHATVREMNNNAIRFIGLMCLGLYFFLTVAKILLFFEENCGVGTYFSKILFLHYGLKERGVPIMNSNWLLGQLVELILMGRKLHFVVSGVRVFLVGEGE